MKPAHLLAFCILCLSLSMLSYCINWEDHIQMLSNYKSLNSSGYKIYLIAYFKNVFCYVWFNWLFFFFFLSGCSWHIIIDQKKNFTFRYMKFNLNLLNSTDRIISLWFMKDSINKVQKALMQSVWALLNLWKMSLKWRDFCWFLLWICYMVGCINKWLKLSKCWHGKISCGE